jgi:hypothetical protein
MGNMTWIEIPHPPSDMCSAAANEIERMRAIVDEQQRTIAAFMDGLDDTTTPVIRRLTAAADEIDRLRADRDCEKRLRKDSDDLATEMRLALEAVLSRPSDTGLAWAVLERIHGVGSGGFVRPNVAGNRPVPGSA